MEGILKNILTEAYLAGFEHGVSSKKETEASYRKMNHECKLLIEKFWLQEKRFYENRMEQNDK